MAAVLSACPSRKTKSQEDRARPRVLGSRPAKPKRPMSAPVSPKRPGSTWTDQPKEGDTGSIVADLLARLPPSPELLQHYQAKLAQYEAEEQELAARVEACARLLDNSNRLEQEVERRDGEIERLRCAVEEASIRLHEERRRGLQLEAENDRLRIKDIESQHKMAVLARLAGKSEAEVLLLVNKAPKQSVRSEEGSEKMAKFRERSRLREKRSSQTMELEVEHLEQQLVEQEKLHREQLQEEARGRREKEKGWRGDTVALRARVGALQETVSGLEGQLKLLAGEVSSARTGHRKAENLWCNERAVLVRKVQFLEKFGTLEGSHSEHRAKARFAGDRKQQARLGQVESLLAAREKELEAARGQMLRLREEVEEERSRSEAAAGILARKTRAMAEQVSVLTERCSKAEVRRAREGEGYQADIRLLRTKMGQLEDRLLAITAACTEDRQNEALLDQLREELKEANKRKPRQWKD